MESSEINLSELVHAAEMQTAAEVTDEFREALSSLVDANHPRELLVTAIADVLLSLNSGYGAGALAVWLGAQVEDGSDPALSGPAIRRTWIKWARQIKTDGDQIEALRESAFSVIEDCSRSLVSHGAASPAFVAEMRSDVVMCDEIARLVADLSGAAWLNRLINQVSGELLVLEPTRQRGALLRYANISNCFHLFTLLQGALQAWLPTEHRPSLDVLDAAMGMSDECLEDHSRWHYQQPVGAAPSLKHSVWGEGHPSEIQSVEGLQVLVIWPTILMSRSWDSGFFSPHLARCPSSVEVIRHLELSEVEAWRVRLDLA